MAKEKDLTNELQEIDDERARRELRARQFANPLLAPKPEPLSRVCDTPLEYLGKEKIPMQAGDDFVVFHPKRRIHRVPRWLAEKHADSWPNDWRIAAEVPEYGEDEIVDAFDIDTEEGKSALRKAFFTDPESTYKRVTQVFWDKIDGLEKEKAALAVENSTLRAQIALLEGRAPVTPPEQTADAPFATPNATTPGTPQPIVLENVDPATAAIIMPYLANPQVMEDEMARRKLNGGQCGSLRQALTEFTTYRTQEVAEKFAARLLKHLPPDGNESLETAGDD